MRRGLLSTLAAAALLAGAATPAAAQNTIGSDLAEPANAGFGCEMSPFQLNYGHPGVGWDPSSCTWGLTIDGSPTFPAQSGTLSQVRIKSGPRTGPTRIVVLRTIYGFSNESPPQLANVCCSVAAATEFFTPAPNAVTTVQTDLQLVGEDTVSGRPGSEGEIDSIGISQINQGQTIPMFDSGVRDHSGFAPVTIAWSPQHTSSELREGTGALGVELLVQGTVTPCPNGPAQQTTRRACAPGGGDPGTPDPGPGDPGPGTPVPTDPTPTEPAPDGEDPAEILERCERAGKKLKVKKLKVRRAKRKLKRIRADGKKPKVKRAKRSLKKAKRQRRRAKLQRLEACKDVDQSGSLDGSLQAALGAGGGAGSSAR